MLPPQPLKQMQKGRRNWALITTLCSPYMIGIICMLGLLCMTMLILFFPFLLFADREKLQGSGVQQQAEWSFPTEIDVDGAVYMWPVPSISRISSYFGTRELLGTVKMHKGIDIANGKALTELQPVYAMAAGTVLQAGAASGYGQVIRIAHEGGLTSVYGHMESVMDVQVGQTVSKGQRIGRIGAGIVGRSTGAHLHFEVLREGVPVNPLGYVQQPGSESNASLTYRALDMAFTTAFLTSRNSALSDRAILTMIDQVGKEKNVSPQLLLAITGQEQSFVPKNHTHAAKILNNPWNVFGSWATGKGATLTTAEAARIAANTIVKLSQDRPAGRDPIEWLSAKDNPRGYYASHGSWWIGVSKFYKILLNGSEAR